MEGQDLKALSCEDLLTTVREALSITRSVGELRRRYILGPALAAGCFRLLLGLLRYGDHFGTLLSGVETMTMKANRRLEELAERIRQDPVLADMFLHHDPSELWRVLETHPAGQAFLAELRAYLDCYGHREAGSILLVSQGTWKDRPEVVLTILKGLTRAELRKQNGQPVWERARDEVLKHPILRLAPVRSIFLKLLAEARWFSQVREDTHFYATLPLPVLRRTLLEFGRRLVAFGVLDTPEDVFHLKFAELEKFKGKREPFTDELRSAVLRRKRRRATLEGVPLVDLRPLAAGGVEGHRLLRGIPGSPGLARGPVCIVHDNSEFSKLRLGDVLVAPYTNPAWTPLFGLAAAVVVDTGGAASHAAIVAREYEIPAVMGTVEGTRRLVDGQYVIINGTTGEVFRDSSAATKQDAGAE